MTPLQRAVELFGTQAKFADALSKATHKPVQQQHVSYWLRTKLPGHYAIATEQITKGEVPRYELRPDLYPEEQPQPPRRKSRGR